MYDELYLAWQKEKENVEIQRLPNDFLVKIVKYIKKIREQNRMLDSKTIKSKLLKRELENAKSIVKELLTLRYNKTLKKALALETIPKGTFTQEEEKWYSEFLLLTDTFPSILNDILLGRLSHVENKKNSKILLRFLQEIPEIVGSDMKVYGPFKPEDIAILPSENARILIRQGVALKIEN